MDFKNNSTPIVISLFIIFFTLSSCSTDSVADNINQEIDEDDLKLAADFIINEERSFVNFILTESVYNSFLNPDQYGDFSIVSKKVYEYFDDEFDFIFIISNESSKPEGLYHGVTYPVQNAIKGIGTHIFNRTRNYGSSGKLKSIIHLPANTYIKDGPFLHEVIHYWGNNDFIETSIGGHWGYSSVGGQLEVGLIR